MVIHAYRVQREHEMHRKRRCISAWHMQCENVAEVSMLATLLQTLLVAAPYHGPSLFICCTSFLHRNPLVRSVCYCFAIVSFPASIAHASHDSGWMCVMVLAALLMPRGSYGQHIKPQSRGVSLHHQWITSFLIRSTTEHVRRSIDGRDILLYLVSSRGLLRQ
jgi:hypothetical protein